MSRLGLIKSIGVTSPGITTSGVIASEEVPDPGFVTLGLQANFNAKDITGLSNLDPLTTWVDSGGSNTVTQATGTMKPTYLTAGFNGRPTVSFDGGDNMFRASTTMLASNTGFTGFFVGTLATLGAFRDIVSVDGLTANGFLFRTVNTNILNLSASSTGVGLDILVPSSQLFVANEEVWGMIKYDSATGNYEVQFRGVTDAGTTGPGTIFNTPDEFTIGSRRGSITPSQFWNGNMSQILLYNRALTTDEVNKNISFIQSEWGIT